MLISAWPVALLSLMLVCDAKRVDRREPQQTYQVRGTVIDSIYGRPIPIARVAPSRSSRSYRLPADHRLPVDSLGAFSLPLPAGQYYVCAEAIGFVPRGAIVVLPRDSARTLVLSLPWQVIKLEPSGRHGSGLPNKRLKLAARAGY